MYCGRVYLFLHIYTSFVQAYLFHTALLFIMGAGLLKSGCIHASLLVYPGRSFYLTSEESCILCRYGAVSEYF